MQSKTDQTSFIVFLHSRSLEKALISCADIILQHSYFNSLLAFLRDTWLLSSLDYFFLKKTGGHTYSPITSHLKIRPWIQQNTYRTIHAFVTYHVVPSNWICSRGTRVNLRPLRSTGHFPTNREIFKAWHLRLLSVFRTPKWKKLNLNFKKYVFTLFIVDLRFWGRGEESII